jgi:hypothetical protein
MCCVNCTYRKKNKNKFEICIKYEIYTHETEFCTDHVRNLDRTDKIKLQIKSMFNEEITVRRI